ncbi:Alpha/Beta hydrolase protein [Mycena alexandri]|uniref:Protein phosphatase methylesterase 1 n=1 Tax=Mycena alexandri TaxID=1745969 RepID=A0AAD6X7S2_9AGAR|nr:Alpha/Beta hydrolase protein [Mycena alexandri]
MSNLLRSTMSARLVKLPLELPPDPSDLSANDSDEDDEFLDAESDELEAGDALGSLGGHGGYSGLGPPAIPFLKPRVRAPKKPNPDFAPISAMDYFADALQVLVPSRSLDCRVYYTPPGGGGETTVLVCHHGAGYSGLSFASLAREVRAQGRGEVGLLAADARRHGKTKSTKEGEEDPDLSIDVLVDDFTDMLREVFPDPTVAPTLLLVGHSMGGSVVVRACPLLLDAKYRVSGVAVLDVVEGSALEALPHMHSLLNARPDGFDSVEEAVEWHVKTKTIRSAQSARVSVPSIVVPAGAADAATDNINGVKAQPPHAYVWRTPLRSTAGYWSGWFTGLSTAFLAARAARLLLLAGTDRLDKPLMIAQMQGKFQMVVVGGVGHMMHEDDPMHVADLLLEFWRRNDRARIPLRAGVSVKGVGEG